MRSGFQTYGPHLLFAISGAAGLALQVLWLERLALLFGNTAYGAATTLALFFLGLACGAFVWGRWSRPGWGALRTYALLEGGVAVSALLFLGLQTVYRALYAPLSALMDHGPQFTATKLLLSAAALLPPAFFMGGTFPVLAQHGGDAQGVAPRQASLYATNTLGAAAGAMLAAFYLRPTFGLTGAYMIALGAIGAAALGAAALARSSGVPVTSSERRPQPSAAAIARSPVSGSAESAGSRSVAALAFFSGFGTLALEVLWTRLLAQVLNNSVYAFAAILVTFLAALALGAWLVSTVLRRARHETVLASLLAGAGGATLVAALAFVWLTRGLSAIEVSASWGRYVVSTFTAAGVLMLVPGALAGGVLPSLFRRTAGRDGGVAPSLGALVAFNALGAVAGALAAGFVLLDVAGVWRSIWLIAAAYAGLAVLVAVRARPLRRAGGARLLGGAVVVAAAVVSLWSPIAALPRARTARSERVERVWEGSAGTVSVIRHGTGLSMRLNNHYVLGDSRSPAVERMQAHLPLLLHAAPDSVFLLGLGTGMTAGATLAHPVKRVLVTELVPDVVSAAREYFAPVANGLFSDRRAVIVTEDGRAYLAGTRERFDVVIADLFTPWHAGTGSLYTREHFQAVRARLRPGGIFAQWLPLYQMSERDVLVVARTLSSVFPEVTVWRGDFSATRPIVALVARVDTTPFSHASLLRNVANLMGATPRERTPETHMVGLFYGGNLRGLEAALASMPVNTEDRPVLEYSAPRHSGDRGSRVAGQRLARFYESLLRAVPPDRDRALRGLPDGERAFVQAGLTFYRYHAYRAEGRSDVAASYLDEFLRQVPTRPEVLGQANPGESALRP